MQILKKFFSFVFILNCVGNSNCATPQFYEWDQQKSLKNVSTLAKMMRDLYNNFESDSQNKNVKFNLTFVKFASEIASLRVVNNNRNDKKDFHQNWAVVPPIHLGNDQTLTNQITDAFNRHIFFCEQPIANVVVSQLMQLLFSFAIRVLLSIVYTNYFFNYHCVGEWQLHTLLFAHKILSFQNGSNDLYGIFPFKIVQLETEWKHWWTKPINEKGLLLTHDRIEQQYIENFNFIKQLSNFTMNHYDIYQLLKTILTKLSFNKKSIRSIGRNKKQNENSSPATQIYTFLKGYFIQRLKKNYKCAFINFGQMLIQRMEFDYPLFKKLAYEKACGKLPFQDPILENDNTPALGCKQLEVQLFQEPLWNYARAIRIDENECKGVLLFAEALINKNADFAKNTPKHSITNIQKWDELNILGQILYRIGDTKNDEKLRDINSLIELQQFLTQLMADYSHTDTCQLLNRKNNSQFYETPLETFGQILFETLDKNTESVQYDDKHQLLTVPLSTIDEILERLYTLIKERQLNPSNFHLGKEMDFVKTLHNIVSVDQSLKLQAFEQRENSFWVEHNTVLLELFFSLAIRLCVQIDEKVDENFGKYLKAFLFVYKYGFSIYRSFDFKINVSQNLVKINVPTWKLPYNVFLDNKNELIAKKARDNFLFLVKLSKPQYFLTSYDFIKMVHILEQVDNSGHILVTPNDPKIFHYILNFLEMPYDDSEESQKIPTKKDYCFLAYFVDDLLEEMKKIESKKKLLKIKAIIMLIERFEEKKRRLCVNSSYHCSVCPSSILFFFGSKKHEYAKYFGENYVNFTKAIKFKFNTGLETLQILSALLAKLEKILTNDGQNNNMVDENDKLFEMIEWHLLHIELNQPGEQHQKWEQIEQMLNACKKQKQRIFKEQLETLKDILEKFKKQMENKSQRNRPLNLNQFIVRSRADFDH